MTDLARLAPLIAPFASLVPVFIGASSVRARRKLIDRLTSVGAIDPAHAITLQPESQMEAGWIMRLERSGVIRAVGNRFYYDQALFTTIRDAQRRQIPLFLLIGLVAFGLGILIVTLLHPH